MNILRFKTPFLILFVCALLSACSTTPDNLPKTSWPEHQATLQAMDTYQASGKIAYRDAHQKKSLNFSLSQKPNYTKLRLFSFIGQTVLTVEITPQGTQIVDLHNQTYQSQDADALVAELSGINVPVTQLPDWLKGLPSGADTIQLNPNGRVQSFTKQIEHQNWQLIYQSYQSAAQTTQALLGMPKSIVLRQGQTELKLAVTNWYY